MLRENIAFVLIIYILLSTLIAPSSVISEIHKCSSEDGEIIYTTNPSTVEGCTANNEPQQKVVTDRPEEINIKNLSNNKKTEEMIKLENRLNEINAQIYNYQLESQQIDKRDYFTFYNTEYTQDESKTLYDNCNKYININWQYQDTYEYESYGGGTIYPDALGNYFFAGQQYGYIKPTEISQIIKYCKEYKEKYEIHISEVQRNKNQLNNYIIDEISKLEQEHADIMKKIHAVEKEQK